MNCNFVLKKKYTSTLICAYYIKYNILKLLIYIPNIYFTYSNLYLFNTYVPTPCRCIDVSIN